MSKKRLKRIEAKLDLILQHLGFTGDFQAFDESIPGGGIKPPPEDEEEDGD